MLISKKKFSIFTIFAIICSIVSISLILMYISDKETDIRVIIWWIGLTVISILNFYLWAIAYATYKIKSQTDAEFKALRRLYPGLTLIYVIVCAFRSILPRAYVARTVLVDSWWSNIFLARLGATFAEISFIILLGLYLKEISQNLNSKFGLITAKIITPPIVIAQVCVWVNIITLNNLFAIIEESIWAVVALLLLISILSFYSKVESKRRPLVAFMCLFLLAYVLFLVVIDIPKYIIRYVADQEDGTVYLAFSDGIDDLLGKWVVSYSYNDWVNEMAWLGLYFSTAVWLTIYLINGPRIKKKETDIQKKGKL
jgi:hypothetical protein